MFCEIITSGLFVGVPLFGGTCVLTRFIVYVLSPLFFIAPALVVFWSLQQQEMRPSAPTPEDLLVVQNAASTLGDLRRSRDRLSLEHCIMERQERSLFDESMR